MKSKRKTNGCKYVPQEHKRSALSKKWYKDGIRDSSAVNDRKNNRPNGKNLPRRSNSQLPSCKSQRCNFQLTIRCTLPSKDSNQLFYVAGGVGKSSHVKHKKCIDSNVITRRKKLYLKKLLII